jgi:hypothetical protein
VIPKTCGSCGQQSTEKPITLYWAWNRADGTRVAWRQKLCRGCLVEQVVPHVAAAMEPLLACPACGISTVDDYDAVYVKAYAPGGPPITSEWPLCPPCAVTVRQRAMVGADALEDRQSGGSGADFGPRPVSAVDTWASLGIVPR